MFEIRKIKGTITAIIEYDPDEDSLCPWMECQMVINSLDHVKGAVRVDYLGKRQKRAVFKTVKAHFNVYDPDIVPGTQIEGLGYFAVGQEPDVKNELKYQLKEEGPIFPSTMTIPVSIAGESFDIKKMFDKKFFESTIPPCENPINKQFKNPGHTFKVTEVVKRNPKKTELFFFTSYDILSTPEKDPDEESRL